MYSKVACLHRVCVRVCEWVCLGVGKHHMTPPWLINYALAFLFSLHTFMQFIITALRGSAEKKHTLKYKLPFFYIHTRIYLSIYAYTCDLFTERGSHRYPGQHTLTHSSEVVANSTSRKWNVRWIFELPFILAWPGVAWLPMSFGHSFKYIYVQYVWDLSKIK